MSYFSLLQVILICISLVIGTIRMTRPKAFSSNAFLAGCGAFVVMVIGLVDASIHPIVFKEGFDSLNWLIITPIAAIVSITCFATSISRSKS